MDTPYIVCGLGTVFEPSRVRRLVRPRSVPGPNVARRMVRRTVRLTESGDFGCIINLSFKYFRLLSYSRRMNKSALRSAARACHMPN